MNSEIVLQQNNLDAVHPGDGSALTPWMQRVEQHKDWPLVSRLPMRLAAAIPVASFKVGNLLTLAVGQVIESGWSSTQDVILKAADVQLFWSEFEVVEQRMAVRLTRLA